MKSIVPKITNYPQIEVIINNQLLLDDVLNIKNLKKAQELGDSRAGEYLKEKKMVEKVERIWYNHINKKQ